MAFYFLCPPPLPRFSIGGMPSGLTLWASLRWRPLTCNGVCHRISDLSGCNTHTHTYIHTYIYTYPKGSLCPQPPRNGETNTKRDTAQVLVECPVQSVGQTQRETVSRAARQPPRQPGTWRYHLHRAMGGPSGFIHPSIHPSPSSFTHLWRLYIHLLVHACLSSRGGCVPRARRHRRLVSTKSRTG